METVFFLAIITVCPISVGNCTSADDWVRYISPPFEVERHMLQQANVMNKMCTGELAKLRLSVEIEGSISNLCVNEDIWRKHHPEHD